MIHCTEATAMAEQYIDLTPQNLAEEHLCCIIRAKPNPGIAAKRTWLSARLVEGHVFRKLDVKDCVFIEYAPLETAWVPVVGDNWLYIYCLWVASTQKGHGYGSALLASCIEDARRQGKSGVCMLGAQKQKAWLSDQSFARRFGFETVNATPDGYELLALSFDGTKPRFAPSVTQRIDDKGLVVYYDMQCPFIPARVAVLQKYCAEKGIPARFVEVDSLAAAKSLPCVFNNWAVFYGGTFQTVNQLDPTALERILKRK